MRYDIHIRAGIREQIDSMATRMRDWESAPRITNEESDKIRSTIRSFQHTTSAQGLTIAGVDGSGDYPSLSYNDSFIYVTVAHATCYSSDPLSGLKEQSNPIPPNVEFTWIPEDATERIRSLDASLANLAGESIERIIRFSDYRKLKARESGKRNTISSLQENLIRPHASDSGNLAIQLRSTGELGAALRLIKEKEDLAFVLIDSTFSLPFINRAQASLFYEHLKRLCCVEALKREVGFFAVSKSHGLPSENLLEEIAREKQGLPQGKKAEHWFFRIPVIGTDGWGLSLTEGKRIPPPGAVSYLVRFHRSTPVLRIDMDWNYWQKKIQSPDPKETEATAKQIFESLDYACHDQRCYGYPYPIKAGHNRASMTFAERVALRKQIIDAAVRAGMKRSLFREVAQETGHA